MYLKRLHLHGFKSFSTRTSLEFSPGTTAIVGPNGSGKSNIADALRWVLGEQSMRQLRGKKSDDIIFAGGNGRGPQGMAEVTLTLDNSAGWLPSEYSEVTVTRRVFRTGDPDYLINGTKVRLKDVLALLSQARIGHDSYTIIGQGLVDQALSARAEDRRSLFEDAAGIRHFQVQRNEAEQRLTQTHVNLSRLHDILGEIEPRLGPLAEQARRAREFLTTRSDLDRMLRQWFGHQWHTTHLRQTQAEATEIATNTRLEELRGSLTAQEATQLELRNQRNDLLIIINDLRRARGEAAARAQGIERDLAVARERAGSVERTRADIAGEQDAVRTRIEIAEVQIAKMEGDLATADETIEAESNAIADLESAIHRARQQQEQEDARLRGASRDAAQAQARFTAAQTDLARLQRQLGERQAALAARRETSAQAQGKADIAQARLEKLRTTHENQRAELGDKLLDRENGIQDIADGQADVEVCRATLGETQRERKALMDRFTLLQEIGGTDTAAAMQAIEDAPTDIRPYVLGPLVELVRVTPEYEHAVEVALGPFLHALVAASEDDAWRCADIFRSAQVGRVLVTWPVGDVNNDPTSLAAQIDPTCGTTTRQVASAIMGSLRFVAGDDPSQLRWEMRDAPIVTANGEMAHPEGWLAVGQAASGAQDGMLARIREMRDLPDQIDLADVQIRKQEDILADARANLERRKTQQQSLERDIKELEAKLSEGAKVVGQAQRDAEKLNNEAQVSGAVEQQVVAEVMSLEEEIGGASERLVESETAQRETARILEDVQAEAEAALTESRAQQEDLAKRRTALAVRRQEEKALQQQIITVRDQTRELQSQMSRREDRLAELHQQAADIAAAVERQTTELDDQRTIARDILTQLQTQEGEAATIDRRLSELEANQAAGRVEITQAEADYRRALVEAQRARDAIETLRTQMTEEMSEGDANEIMERDQADAPLDPIPPDDLPKMRRTIDSLRGKLKSLGGYDPEAPQAYEELKTRYEFITAQVRDMEEASARLRAVIMELDTTMRRRFEETFQLVNERFRQHFTTLFQGGTARLELTTPKRAAKDEDDDEAEDAIAEPSVTKKGMVGGVEVYVQIPGKKVQDLGLLSGGERAMVSAALLFALLETNPPPFCLLDEVDAALDESNVVRFCEILVSLANMTQFIIITHNRVTMTHANAIYGVSMTDSVSRILSMRLAEAQSA